MSARTEIEASFGREGFSPSFTVKELVGATGLAESTIRVVLRLMVAKDIVTRWPQRANKAATYTRGPNWNPPHKGLWNK